MWEGGGGLDGVEKGIPGIWCLRRDWGNQTGLQRGGGGGGQTPGYQGPWLPLRNPEGPQQEWLQG